jgi:hypothetical protein
VTDNGFSGGDRGGDFGRLVRPPLGPLCARRDCSSRSWFVMSKLFTGLAMHNDIPTHTYALDTAYTAPKE